MAPASNNTSDRPEPGRRALAELSALADGTLAPDRSADAEARIAASPELSVLYKRERRVVEALHEARATERAPARLRARIQAQRPSAAALSRRRVVYGGGLAGVLAAAVLALVLALPGGTPGAPSVSQAAALASLGIAAPAPAPDPKTPGVKLERSVGGTYFPNWSSTFHWRAVGQRVDHVGGRLALTVFYEWRGKRIAYTIVAAPALTQPQRADVSQLEGTELHTFTLGGRLVVTWRRSGHTCVLSGAAVPPSVLQHLAAWSAPGLERDHTTA